MTQTLAVAIFGALAILFAATVFRTGSMMRSALALLAAMVAIGFMFFALEAEFLGTLQLMMMAPEMAIMAIFMVMFMMDPGGLGQMDMSHQKSASRLVAALGAGAGLALAALVDWGRLVADAPTPATQLRSLGLEIMGRSLFVFEAAGVTILTGMVAATAVAIARRR